MNLASETDVVILCGGKGTRIQSLFPNTPKLLLPFPHEPFSRFLMKYLNQFFFRRYIFAVGHLSEKIEAELNVLRVLYPESEFLLSKEIVPHGTAGAVKQALPLLCGDNTIVLNGDSFCEINFNEFFSFHSSHQKGCSIACVSVSDAGRFGRVVLSEKGEIRAFQEKANFNQPGLVNAGIYCFRNSFLQTIPENSNVSLEVDIFPHHVWNCRGFVARNATLSDIGTPSGYSEGLIKFFQPGHIPSS